MNRAFLLCFFIVFLGALSLVTLRFALELIRLERQLRRVVPAEHPLTQHRTP